MIITIFSIYIITWLISFILSIFVADITKHQNIEDKPLIFNLIDLYMLFPFMAITLFHRLIYYKYNFKKINNLMNTYVPSISELEYVNKQLIPFIDEKYTVFKVGLFEIHIKYLNKDGDFNIYIDNCLFNVDTNISKDWEFYHFKKNLSLDELINLFIYYHRSQIGSSESSKTSNLKEFQSKLDIYKKIDSGKGLGDL